jgi:hypothetical protein
MGSVSGKLTRELEPRAFGPKNRGMSDPTPRNTSAAAHPRIAMISTHGYVAAQPPQLNRVIEDDRLPADRVA